MLSIAWTTTATLADAERLATRVVESGLAACAQIDGPITSIYHWEGKIEQAREYRLSLKFVSANQTDLEALVSAEHPYDTPEWVVVASSHVSEKYLSWARANTQSNRL